MYSSSHAGAVVATTVGKLDVQNSTRKRQLASLAIAITLAGISGLGFARGALDFLPNSYFHQPRTERLAGSNAVADPISLYSAEQRKAGFAACADQFPKRETIAMSIVPSDMKPMALCSNGFAVLYSQTSKTPLVVVERLFAARLRDAKGEERTNEFFADPRIPAGGRAELTDFRNQNPSVDRGHMSPAADAPDQHAMAQSFALSNMVAQDPTSNRKPWNKIEQDVRKFASRANGNVFVYTGPLFAQGFSTIGKNHVWVPTHLYKLVYDESSGRAWAYIQPNAPVERVERPIDYAAFVKTTGLALLGSQRVVGTIR